MVLQIELVYNVLNGQARTIVDAAVGGTIFAKSPNQAYDLLEKMTINSFRWPIERYGVNKPTSMYFIDPITSFTAQFSVLVTQITVMSKGAQPNSVTAAVFSTNERSSMEKAQYVDN